jgi:hypothetical protein
MNACLGKHPEFATKSTKRCHTQTLNSDHRRNTIRLIGDAVMTDHLPTSSTDRPASSSAGHIRRFATDAIAGLGLFTLGMVMTSGTSALAATLTLDNASGLLQQPSVADPVVLLAAVFSVLFALNAAFFRHLARAYVRSGRK